MRLVRVGLLNVCSIVQLHVLPLPLPTSCKKWFVLCKLQQGRLHLCQNVAQKNTRPCGGCSKWSNPLDTCVTGRTDPQQAPRNISVLGAPGVPKRIPQSPPHNKMLVQWEPAQTENLWKWHLEMAFDDIWWLYFASVGFRTSDSSWSAIGIFPNLFKLRTFGKAIWKWPPMTSGGWILHPSGSRNQTGSGNPWSAIGICPWYQSGAGFFRTCSN